VHVKLTISEKASGKLARSGREGALKADGVHAGLGAHATGHVNDMVLDADGTAYVGNFGFDLMTGAPQETAAPRRTAWIRTAVPFYGCAAPDFVAMARSAAREAALIAFRADVPVA
jgi:hypothetical protein